MGSANLDLVVDLRGLGARQLQLDELDDDRVLVIVHNRGRGKTSGLEVGPMWQKSANLFEIHDRKVKKLVAYWDGDRALADTGLAGRDEMPPT